MESWNISNEQKDKFRPIIEKYINDINNSDECEIVKSLNLTFSGISPIQLKDLLKEFGYEEVEFDSNGWQYDFWIKMVNHEDSRRSGRLTILGCGISFSLKIYPTDNDEC